MHITSKSQLAIILSRLEGFSQPKVSLEQYSTPSEIASDILWNMSLRGELAGKRIVDLGCGPGTLGLGAALLDAKESILLDIDPDAISVAKKNLSWLKSQIAGDVTIMQGEVQDFFAGKTIHAVIQNPPFGIKNKNADREFLLKAMMIADIIYSFHKSESEEFIKALAVEKGFNVDQVIHYAFPLPALYSFHTRRIHKIAVGCWRISRKKK